GPGFLRGEDVVRSMERQLEPVSSGDLASSWTLATEAQGFDLGISDLGTPTNSGRPSLVLPSECVAGVGETQGSLQIGVADPDGIPTITTVLALLDSTPLLAEVDPATWQIGVRLPEDTPPGSHELMVTASEPSGLSRTVRMRCDIYRATGTVQIDEVYPAPVPGEREFIELQNTGDEAVDLFGWLLDDQDGKGSQPYR